MDTGILSFGVMTLVNGIICLTLPRLVMLDWSKLGRAWSESGDRPSNVAKLTVASENLPQA